MSLVIKPGLNVRNEQPNYVELSLRPYPDSPALTFYELVIDRKFHGNPAPASVQIQTDEYGGVVVRVQEGPGLSALVLPPA